MANPQAENGHTDIANEILEALWRVNLSAHETRVLLYLLRKTYGWHKKTDRIALSQFSKDIGIDRRLIHRAIKKLSSNKHMIVIYRDDKNNITYGFQKNYERWKVSSKQMTVIYRDDKVSSKEMIKLSSKEIPTKETTKEKNIYSPDLEIFYQAYPFRQGKKEASDIWNKINPQNGTREAILQAVERQKAYKEYLKKTGQFCPEWPMPGTWLNQRRWEDEVPNIHPESDFL
jgi:phage replication O-like protein O